MPRYYDDVKRSDETYGIPVPPQVQSPAQSDQLSFQKQSDLEKIAEEKRLKEFVETMTAMTPACVANARTLQILLFPLSISYLIVRHDQEEEGACARGGETLQEVETT